MSASSSGSKAHPSNPKSQNSKGKPVASAPGSEPRGVVPQPSREPIPMKPRKGLFVALMAVFVAWMGVMLAMYVTTVRPRPPSAPPTAPPPATTAAPALAGEASSSSSEPASH